MSAQIITALRARAQALETEADRREQAGASEIPHQPEKGDIASLRFLAREFAVLADAAEHLPRDPVQMWGPGGF
jgi:hypothetical protein